MKYLSIIILFNLLSIYAQAAEGTTPQGASSAWSPYLAGAGIGLLLCATMFFSKKPVGASSAYATAAGLAAKAVAPNHTHKLKYFQENPPRIGWEFLFVLATIAGGGLAAWHGGELAMRWLQPAWVQRFGENSLWLRAVTGIGGGVLLAFGARMAKGCTSGHGISGAAQLNVGSWIALVCFFVGGVIVANLMFRI